MNKVTSLIIVTSLLSGSVNAVEIDFSGFGSLVGTSLLSDEGYWVKHPSGAGRYSEDVGFEIKEESLLGVQATARFTPDLTITTQVILRGQDDWKSNVEQFYLSYNVNSSWNVKLGKLRNPVYLFSDTMDIHYSYGWLRTPGSSYSLSANSYDGVSAMYTNAWGAVSNRTIFYSGKVDKNPDPFLTELFVNRGFNSAFTTGEVDASGNFFPLIEYRNTIEDVLGISTEFYLGDWTTHLAFMEAGGEKGTITYSNGSQFVEKYPWRDFYDVAVSYDDGDWIAIAEWNQYVDVYSSYYFTLGKYFDEWQVLLTYGNFEGEVKLANGFVLPDAAQEFTDTITISTRYDFAAGVAFKAELVFFENTNSLIVPDIDGDGKIDSTVLSIALDFVF